MKCKDMPQHLVSLLYGEIEPEEAKKIKTHIKSCVSCGKAFQELKTTSKLLQKWEDETPSMKLVFVGESASRWKTWKEKVTGLSWGRRLALGVPALAVFILIGLAALNSHISYREGEWDVAFSLIPIARQPKQEQILLDAIDQKQQETLLLVSRLIEDSEYRQRRETALTLAQFAQDIEKQRQQDLRMVGLSLEGFQRTTEGRFHQTSDMLNDLIRLTSYNLEKK